MSDRLHQTEVIWKDDVNPDSIMRAFQRLVFELEKGAERRRVALDWNAFRAEFSSPQVANNIGAQPGDLRIQASVAVL